MQLLTVTVGVLSLLLLGYYTYILLRGDKQ